MWLCATLCVAGCESLVGGECLPGFAVQGTACVPIADGSASTGSDASSAQGGSSGSSDGGAGAGSSGTASGGAGAAGSASGGSGTMSGGPAGTGGQGGGCVPPLVSCPPDCVDLQTDYLNCGACGNYCPTEVCVDGECTGSPVGHLIVVGMDFTAVNTPMSDILGNAVFLPPDDPVRILDYREHAEPNAASQVELLVGLEAIARGRTFGVQIEPNGAALGGTLSSGVFDVLLVHHQANAPAAAMSGLGLSASAAINDFASGGGTIVVLASNQGTSSMSSFLSNSGILAATGFGTITGSQVKNAVPNDVIGIGVSSPFLAKSNTVTITTSESPGPEVTYVCTENTPGGGPVVIHKTLSQ